MGKQRNKAKKKSKSFRQLASGQKIIMVFPLLRLKVSKNKITLTEMKEFD